MVRVPEEAKAPLRRRHVACPPLVCHDMNARRFLVPLVACTALSCSDLSPELDDLRHQVAVNRARWAAVGPATYVYEVEHACFCALEAVGPVRVSVEGGSVTARAYVQSGEPVDSAFAGIFPSVDGLFDVLERAIEREADDVRVTWDPDTGAPLDFSIDYLKNAVDEEESYRIVDGPRTTP
jgi:hypothetical protein